MRKNELLLSLLLLFATSLALELRADSGVVEAHGGIALRHDNRISTLRVPAPVRLSRPRIASSIFQVNYVSSGLWGDTCASSWPAQAQLAVDRAIEIWSELITSAVPIRIDLCLGTNLYSGILGHGGATNYFYGFSGAPLSQALYPVALANSLHGSDLDPGNSDIYLAMNSSAAWYYGLDGNTPNNLTDFLTVLLHEIGHGLGMISSFDISSGLGSWGDGWGGHYSVYDYYVYNNSVQQLIGFSTPSGALATQLTSNSIYFSGSHATAANHGTAAKLYAPASWSSGSSIAHLDDIYNNSENAMMTWSLSSGESMHSPGPIMLGLFEDLGWTIEHADLATTVVEEADPAQPGVRLNYQATVVNTGPGVADEVTATFTRPSNSTYQGVTSAQGSCTSLGLIVTCSLGRLTVGQSVALQLTIVPTQVGQISLTFGALGMQSDPNSANNTATAETAVAIPTPSPTPTPTPVPAQADLTISIKKRVSCTRSSCTLDAQLKNNGNAQASIFKVSIVASANKLLDNKDRVLKNITISGGLGAGASKTITKLTFKNTIKTKERYLFVIVDKDGQIAESNKGNNMVITASR